ncbi:hypothetical protein EJ05DRAFT_479087 [Pseudovirgaria hyperparasitica]|uniref:Peptidase S59 domain-containing protein n=1 Tax=Pseudovirgaria hyperparasitica TaxID=470096 RepID=A0A6A6VYB1_9PEZI|nr:uncharacterized protein EJ05DRAFT_479087 [Pseudovirgaria hyperparasitica]KAF2754650.1 hypothetical protein EJ05DRAFT_479087 [Pseudovirgaria hyperparasitica]
MSGFGGFGGFGANSQQQNTGFGGFGQNNNNNSTGFGASANIGFGANNNNNNNNNNTGAFGSTGGGFGGNTGGFGNNNNTSSGFGANKPTFGGTGLFGGNNNAATSTGFGAFGQNNNQTSGGFGSTGTSGGVFGTAKPTFGSGTPTGGGLFGSANTGFGSNNNTFGGGSTGFGANTTQNNGTDAVPFQPVNEKDGQAPGAASVSYQSISTMDQYKNFSQEELRLVDYNKGKRYGTTNGQGGTFGQSSGFGGFGGTTNTAATGGFGTNTTGGGLFGNNNNNNNQQPQQPAGFGQANNTSTFGNTPAGGLFGQNKPASSGLFGGAATSGTAGGGLFGSSSGNTGFGVSNGATGAFGSVPPTGGLFGANNNNNQAQNKPAFGGFGASTGTGTFGSNTNNTTGFGQSTSTSTGSGLFGQQQNTNTGFGANNQQQNTNSAFGSSFGQNNQQQSAQQPSGGLFGGGGTFGQTNNNNPPKPGLFGAQTSAATGSSLFGQNSQQQNTGGGLFGATNNQNQPANGGLFGQKPTGTTGLFGSQPAATNTNNGLFGGLSNQNQQNQATGLFGQQNQNQGKLSLFGGTNSTGGNGLFGSQNQAQQQNTGSNGGLFGGSQHQQQPQPQMNHSLFGSQNTQNRPQGLVASLDNLPYGNEQLFAHLENPSQSVGPIATPLKGNHMAKKNAILPQHKLNPAASTRLITPQKRPPTGFGFSYSTYGTPGSAASNASPGSFASNLLNGSSFSRSLGKSFSTSNLRGSFTPDDSILSPGAFTASPRGYASGSLKRLHINRNVNGSHHLFTPAEVNNGIAPSPLKNTKNVKSVTFATSAGTETSEIGDSQALVRTTAEDSATKPNGAVHGFSHAEGDSINGKALASVPENMSSSAQSAKPNPLESMKDKEPAEYFTIPSIAELRKMSRDQLKHVKDFTVGRVNTGKVIFSEADLSSTPLDKITGGIVEIEVRSASVYSGDGPVKKPPRGMGMNVPSTIVLENSWPRAKAGRLPVHENKGPRFEKHVSRLKRVPDTQFVNYDMKTGIWTFRVDHFTKYGMDFEGDDSNVEDDLESSMLSAPPDTPTPKTRTPVRTPLSTITADDLSGFSDVDSELDDTFEFQRRRKTSVPGGFEDEPMVDHNADDHDDTLNSTRSFLDERSMGSFPENGPDGDTFDVRESVLDKDQEMAGSFPVPAPTMEHLTAAAMTTKCLGPPKSILKTSRTGRSLVGTPSKKLVDFQDNWTTQLQLTVSPTKRDRQALRESQGTVLQQKQLSFHEPKKLSDEDKPFRTSMDIMNSLYGRDEKPLINSQPKINVDGLCSKIPFTKKPKVTDASQLTGNDKAFHECNKPHWSPDGTLVYAINANAPTLDEGMVVNVNQPLVGEQKDIRYAQVAVPKNAVPDTMVYLKNFFQIRKDDDNIPYIQHSVPFSFADFAARVDTSTSDGAYEQKVWHLASILFDKPNLETAEAMPQSRSAAYETLFRKDRLSEFWQSIVQVDADSHAERTNVSETKALQQLSAHNISDACISLLEGRNLHLATMVAQIGGSESMRREIGSQLEEWRTLNVLSEMTDTIRAIYELLAGNCSTSDGKSGSGPENKATTFRISSRFKMDWRRAFGLRLWYGTLPSEDIAMAVAQYESDLREGREYVKPVPWFAEEQQTNRSSGCAADHIEDLLWGLLKLYAVQFKDIPINVEEILAPANASGNPLDARLSWQLITLLRTRKEIKLPVQQKRAKLDASMVSSTSSMQSVSIGSDPHGAVAISDDLTLTYGAMLEDTQAWKTSIFVYLHLSSASLRESNIRRVLTLKSGDFEILPTTPDPSPAHERLKSDCELLITTLQLPLHWLHSAKALYARAVLQDPTLEIQHLLAAADYFAAHDVLCTVVAPSAIISRDYVILRQLLGAFERPQSHRKPTCGKDAVSGGTGNTMRYWSQGGQIYLDFIYLMDTGRGAITRGTVLKEERGMVLKRLVAALSEMTKTLEDGKLGLQERAAVWEMARITAGWVQSEDAISKSEIVKLPLMEDGWLRCARERGVEYFRGVLAYAR